MALFRTWSTSKFDPHPGMKRDIIVAGLPDLTVRESRERIKSARINSGSPVLILLLPVTPVQTPILNCLSKMLGADSIGLIQISDRPCHFEDLIVRAR
jgi:hypothetical protein